jgi:hypothetical protein
MDLPCFEIGTVHLKIKVFFKRKTIDSLVRLCIYTGDIDYISPDSGRLRAIHTSLSHNLAIQIIMLLN